MSEFALRPEAIDKPMKSLSLLTETGGRGTNPFVPSGQDSDAPNPFQLQGATCTDMHLRECYKEMP
jgi:hypothetical protein